MLHLHEPIAPGPPMTTLILRAGPMLGTFHMAGESASYKYLTPAIRRAASYLDERVVVSKDALKIVQRYIPGDYEVLFNGVEIDRFKSATARPGGERAIFFCGRHEPRKGLDVLLAAHARLPRDVRLWIASDGPDTARLQEEYSGDPRIEWLGRVSDDEKIARLKGAAVFCAPSLHGESFGVVLIEAMAAGTPVVASALDGYRNVATDGVDALLVPPGDVDALIAALTTALDDEAVVAPLRAAGMERASRFSMRTLAELYLAKYRVLVARGHHGANRESAGHRWRMRLVHKLAR